VNTNILLERLNCYFSTPFSFTQGDRSRACSIQLDATRALEACPSWEVAGIFRWGYARPPKYVISSVV